MRTAWVVTAYALLVSADVTPQAIEARNRVVVLQGHVAVAGDPDLRVSLRDYVGTAEEWLRNPRGQDVILRLEDGPRLAEEAAARHYARRDSLLLLTRAERARRFAARTPVGNRIGAAATRQQDPKRP